MPTDPAPQGVGSRRLERYLAIIVGVFGLLYALQTLDSLVADWPSMRGPAGVAAVGLVSCSVLAGLSVLAPRVPLRAALHVALWAYAAALVVWPFAQHGPVPVDPMPWFIAISITPAAYSAVAVRTPALTAVASVAIAGYIGGVLVLLGSHRIEQALVNGLFFVALSTVLSVLVAALRRAARRADEAQRVALSGFARSRLDEATESERVRTDALVHDCVLTTFLAAASAQTPDTEDLAARMAANALRVLQHVNREGGGGPVVPFARAIAEAEERLAPLSRYFEIRTDGADDVVLPIEVADTMLEAMAQAMSNSVRHAGEADRSVRMSRLGPDGLRIVVADDGVGFDLQHATATGGLRLTVVQGLRDVDGRADLISAPGRGCTVVLSWGSVVIHGVTPLPAEGAFA